MPFGPRVDFTAFCQLVLEELKTGWSLKSSKQLTQVPNRDGTDKRRKTGILSFLLSRSIVKDLCGVEGRHDYYGFGVVSRLARIFSRVPRLPS